MTRIRLRVAAVLAVALALITSPAHAATVFDDWFAVDTVGTTYGDGQYIRTGWHVDFLRFGTAEITTDGTNHFLTTAPGASTTASETNSTLVTTQTTFSADYTIKTEFGNEVQLRTGAAPNVWERAWTLWNVNVDSLGCYSFEYLILKSANNAGQYELGKDTCSNGIQTQIFLSTGSTGANWTLSSWKTVNVTQTVDGSGQPTWTVKAKKDAGILTTLVTFTDTSGNAPTSGKLGLYAEDAQVDWGGADVVTDESASGTWQATAAG
jgi:hypothetical protein